MKILSPIAATLAIALSTASVGAVANNDALAGLTIDLATANLATNGQATFVTGSLGVTTPANTISALKNILSTQAVYQSVGNEDFAVKRQWTDKLGKRHTHLSQTINGLKVYGTSLIVHANTIENNGVLQNDSANIYAVSGTLATNTDAAVKSLGLDSRSSKKAAKQAAALGAQIGKVAGTPELAYVYLPQNGETKLAWKMEVSWDHGGDNFGRDIIFYDYHNSTLLTRHAQVHSVKSWKTYSLDNKSQSSAPGRLLCTDNQSCGDASGTRAHDGASGVYDYYKAKFGRNGIDNNDMTMVSSVHLDRNLNNAYWTGSQMMYGDGDGQTLGDLTLSYDVIGHELTHGVTQHTAGLIYQGASGALNEAWSDILGAASKAAHNNTQQPDWLLGREAYTPNTPGDAIRYMDNPTKDNYSKDWWPERLSYSGGDNGGVHGNSGIANLAFVLLVEGGTHPRGKSPAVVSQLGLAKSEQIFYRALNTYMSQSTNFAGARTATAQAAQDLYGATEKAAVETAWCAVGVGDCDTGPKPTKELTNGVAATGISASTGQDVIYTLDVPAGSTNISFNTSGGTGDADMYVKFGADPTDSSYDCRPYENGNVEACTGTQTGGKYHVRLKAYSSFSGVSLTGSYSGDVVTEPTAPVVTVSNPTSGAKYTTGSTVAFAATATDADGSVDNVEFVLNGQILATDRTAPYSYNWTATTGSHSLVVTATDNEGQRSSKTVNFSADSGTSTCNAAAWSASAIYTAGDRVSAGSNVWEARWWTQNENPTAGQSDQYYVWFVPAGC